MNIVKFDELINLEVTEYQKVLQDSMADVTAFIATLTEEEILEQEKSLMEVFTEEDSRLKAIEYTLPNRVFFDGVEVPSKTVRDHIAQALGRLEVEFTHTKGVYDLISFWNKEKTNTIPYPAFDSTLRLLGTLKFKGESQLRQILVINEYLTPAHQAYQKDVTYTHYLAMIHSALLDAMKGPEVGMIQED